MCGDRSRGHLSPSIRDWTPSGPECVQGDLRNTGPMVQHPMLKLRPVVGAHSVTPFVAEAAFRRNSRIRETSTLAQRRLQP